MKNIIWVIVAVVVIGGVVWYLNRAPEPQLQENVNNEATTTPPTSNLQPPTSSNQPPVSTYPAGRSITVSLNPIAPVNQTGTVTVSEYSATKTRVVVRVNNALAYQPAHIHEGKCNAPNGVGGIEWSLNSIRNGTSDTIVGVAYNKLRIFGNYYSVVVHKSTSEMTVYTACADIPVF